MVLNRGSLKYMYRPLESYMHGIRSILRPPAPLFSAVLS